MFGNVVRTEHGITGISKQGAKGYYSEDAGVVNRGI